MTRLSPVQIFAALVLAAIGAFGWFYGWHWKQVASGGKATHEEKLIIQLQDQLDAARAENERLTGLLRVAEGETNAAALPESTGEGAGEE